VFEYSGTAGKDYLGWDYDDLLEVIYLIKFSFSATLVRLIYLRYGAKLLSFYLKHSSRQIQQESFSRMVKISKTVRKITSVSAGCH